jgi:hypothetical protein
MLTSLEVARFLILSTLGYCHKLKLEKTVSYGGHKKGMKLSVIIVSAGKADSSSIEVIKTKDHNHIRLDFQFIVAFETNSSTSNVVSHI